MTYSLYTFSAPNLPDNHAMMLTIPFVMYGIFRYLYLIHVPHRRRLAGRTAAFRPASYKSSFSCTVWLF